MSEAALGHEEEACPDPNMYRVPKYVSGAPYDLPESGERYGCLVPETEWTAGKRMLYMPPRTLCGGGTEDRTTGESTAPKYF
jgi:hypothetical protein